MRGCSCSSAGHIRWCRRPSGNATAASSRAASGGRTRLACGRRRATSTPTSGRASLADHDRRARRRAGARHLERLLLREADRPGQDGRREIPDAVAELLVRRLKVKTTRSAQGSASGSTPVRSDEKEREEAARLRLPSETVVGKSAKDRKSTRL